MMYEEFKKLVEQSSSKTLEVKEIGETTFYLDECESKGKKIYFISKDEMPMVNLFDYESAKLVFDKYIEKEIIKTEKTKNI